MSKRQTRSDGLLQSTKNGGKPNYWTGNSDPRPIEAPQELIFNGKFQYSKFECPPNLEESKIRAEGFYNHAYAPIGNDNALYTPMPKDMFQQMEFDRILVPSETRTISMLDYMKKYQPQKTYMAVSYFQALANGTLPESYGAPKKKLKNEQGNLGQLPEIMQECDDLLDDVDLEMEMAITKLKKKEAKKRLEEQREKKKAARNRDRIALEEYFKAAISHNMTVVPFRNDRGAICYALKSGKLTTEELSKDLMPFWKEGRAKKPSAGSRGFNTRNEKYRLREPLKILVQEVAKQRFGTDWESIFKLMIKHICEMEGMSNQLKLIEDDSKPDKHILLATDPFGLYTAYIHEDCVHEYMEYLCKPEKEEPATMFGDEDDLQVLPDPAPTTTDDQGSGVAANQSNNATALNGNQGTFLPTAISNSARALPDEDFIGRMENLLDDAFHNTAQRAKAAGPLKQKLDATGRTPSPNVLCTSQQSHLEQLWKQGGSLQSAPHFTKNGPIGLSWAKINGAGGTRMDPTKNKAQQGETMKTSAGLMAVTTLGWEHYDLTPDSGRRMKSGCHIAEWLHLCAYSWGGTTQSKNYVQSALTESQSAQNLVFGTSEANSCMTRYEKSWQKLIEHENTLFNNGSRTGSKTKGKNTKVPDRLTGSLHVTRNPTKSIFSNTSGGAGDVWVDEKDGNGRYKWTLYEDFLTKSEQAAPHLLAAAKQFPCIAYSIEYDITLESHSKILDCDKATSRTYFYPFSRRFYHRSENLLDRALYQYMVLLALGKEYEKPSEAFTVFSAWFKTLLLPKELLKPFKSDTTGPLASTNGPLASTNMSGGSSLFSQYINPTSTSIANAMSMLNFSKIPTNSHF